MTDIKTRLEDHFNRIRLARNDQGQIIHSNLTKETIRNLHSLQRQEILEQNQNRIRLQYPSFRYHFATGNDIDPKNIQPRLELVRPDEWQSNLFTLASLTWSAPVTQGFGRRLKYLVWDDSNQKLMGLIALCDPIRNLKTRDDYVGWNLEMRYKMLVNSMNAYVLGALPPYNLLLGGKMIACLMKTREILDDFRKRYKERTRSTSKEKKRPELLLITTSSALGRSSVYNRLRLDGEFYLRSVGFTSGWGVFHIPEDIYQEIRQYARKNNISRPKGDYGKMILLKETLNHMGLNSSLMNHGIKREVFVTTLDENATRILCGEDIKPNFQSIRTVEEVGELAKKRWIVPRAERRPDYRDWTLEQLDSLLNTKPNTLFN